MPPRFRSTGSINHWGSLVAAILLVVAAPALAEPQNRALVLIVDGLRHDYITPELMPNLHHLGQEGMVAARHHVAYPPKTRVNAASLATGAHPGAHGLMHNHLHLRDPINETFNTGWAMPQLREALGDQPLLSGVTLGDALEDHGRSLLAIGAGSPGSTILLNPTDAGHGVINPRASMRGHELAERAIQTLGPADFDDEERPTWARDRWAIDVFNRIVLTMDQPPDVTLLWISALDGVQHGQGVGTPEVIQTVSDHIDVQIGRLLEALDTHGLRDHYNIFISTDHGFSTHRGFGHVPGAMNRAGVGERSTVAGLHQVYLDSDEPDDLQRAVRELQRTPGIGPIFTAPAQPGDTHGRVEGTLSFDLAQWNHPRAGAILASPDWDSQANEHGYAGHSTHYSTAGHSTLSPHEMRVHMIAAGPDIKSSDQPSHAPTGNLDIAPTILHLAGMQPPETMQGRILHELLRDGPDPASVPFDEQTHTAEARFDGGLYRMTLHSFLVDDTRYLYKAEIQRDGFDDE